MNNNLVTRKSLIAPSVLSADFGRLADEIGVVERAGADLIHVDVMDGHFVPNITIGPLVVRAAKKAATIPLDVHLMIENPQRFIKEFISAGADFVSVHAEADRHLDRAINLIKENGAKAGVAINPATPVKSVKPVLAIIDFVVIMSVNPGFGGQKFIPYCLEKIKKMREMVDSLNPKCLIEVDGGVSLDNIGEVSGAGADVLVSGSGIFHTKDYIATVKEMRKLI